MRCYYVHQQCFISKRAWLFGIGGTKMAWYLHICGLTFISSRRKQPAIQTLDLGATAVEGNRLDFLNKFADAVVSVERHNQPVSRLLINPFDLRNYRRVLGLADLGWRGYQPGEPYYDPTAPNDVVGWIWGSPVCVSNSVPQGQVLALA